ncbi:histidine--tRNA ligase [Botrimarina sp.]|uniref:histidine--tRNA ligase n=1 Tax=Botrimarina sp. TaxID=2795802 RepID=UPI0032ECD909
MPERITPRTLKGFRDYPPEVMIPRERLMETARRVYRSYGYAPIDTPALEYLEVLTGKGSDETDKQLYRFQDHGGRDVGLRFDLTVPLARFAAQHAQQLGLPFKRYHIGPVWRGENTQKGRYREFVQCDFDTVGVTGVASDVEVVLVVHDLMLALGVGRFTIRINHRGVLNGLLETLGLADRSVEVLRALDKLTKAGPDKVRAELAETAGATDQQADALFRFAETGGDAQTVLDSLRPLVGGNALGAASLDRLAEVLAGVAAGGVASGRVQIDPSIARGLDYYTGLVLETTLDDLPGIGSVASGGRYDDLAGVYTNQALPGIGASLGVDRLLAAMEELGLVDEVRTPADALVVFFDGDRLADYVALAARLRAAGVATEVYPEPKKLGKQLQYADKKGFRLAVIAGPDELAAGECQLKDLATGESKTVRLDAAAEAALAALGRA